VTLAEPTVAPAEDGLFYDPNTRTGILAVDRFLDAFSMGKEGQIASQSVFSGTFPCPITNDCGSGIQEGTPVPGFPFSSCTPSLVTQTQLETRLKEEVLRARLYGIFEPSPPPGGQLPFGTTYVVVVKADDRGFSIWLDDQGKAVTITTCDQDEWPPGFPAQRIILPPRG
jgi:hypothetical protein